MFFVLPFMIVIYYSVVDNPISKQFVFMDNFVSVFQNAAFQQAAKNTLTFSFVAVPLAVVLSLPEKYRDVIYLHYYEGYSAVEIGKLLGRSENTVYTWLSRARAALKDKLGGDWP